ncbi:uncharacterized protein LOC129841458 isoform X2 [Salvelinus fontinalis]|uniref:uncharacterized protein LOC129841458 isoform X2 n=1 Tax=Salvelinus fontinalis TaxID=8038 RepID=UPI0024868365|nr:uncharacterized protein LOC129841458 isoform X2 [Salvelinus fontinalis]
MVFHTQIASIMEVLANAAVAEICKLVDDDYAVFRLEITQSQKENRTLRRKLQLLELKVSRERVLASRPNSVKIFDRNRGMARGHLTGGHRSIVKAAGPNAWRDDQPITVDEGNGTSTQHVIVIESAEAAGPGGLSLVKQESTEGENPTHSRDIQTGAAAGVVPPVAVEDLATTPQHRTRPSITEVVNRISACLADISVWMTDHHLKLNLGKTELLLLPGKDCPFHDLAITVDNSIVSSSQSAKNLGVILDNTLSFSTNIKAVTCSCSFMLYNIRRVRPCLTQEAAQVLIQALVISRLDYCNSLLAGLPACAIKPLQLIQNAAARLVFNFPKFSHVTPLLRSLHWLPVEARIRYKTMVLAYGAVRGTAPPYLQALIRPYTQTRALRSSTSGLLAPPYL